MRKKLFLPTVFLLVMVLGFNCFASPTNIRGTIYGNDSMNSQVIAQFNDLSKSEQESLIQKLFPLYVRTLGFYYNSDDLYSFLNSYYHLMLNSTKSAYSSADDYFNNHPVKQNPYLFVSEVDGGHIWNDDLVTYLSHYISVVDNSLVLNDSSGVYDVINFYLQEQADNSGMARKTLHSAYKINSNCFGNLTRYNAFINLCNSHKNSKYVLIYMNSYNSNYASKPWILVMFPKTETNLYMNGVNANDTVNNLKLCDSNGVSGNKFEDYDIYQINGDVVSEYSFASKYVGYSQGLTNAAAEFLGGNGMGYDGSNRFKSTPFNIYTLNSDNTVYNLYTSLNGWVANNGYYEAPYQLANYYNKVPNAIINANNMTTYYNNNYTNNITNGPTTNIYYPPTYIPDGNPTYNPDDETVSFGGITELLSSLGKFIGSIINGLAQGLANLIASITSIMANLSGLISSGFSDFLTSFFGWLPSEFVTMILGFLTISVFFGIIKLIKG